MKTPDGLADIGSRLAQLYVQRGDLLHDKSIWKADLANIELHLLKDGVEGKNEEMRRLNRQLILLNDDEWRSLDELVRRNDALLCKLDAQIAALEAQRRGREWEIRAALAGYTLRHDGDGDLDEAAANTLTDAPAAYSVEQIEAAFDRHFRQ